MQHGARDGHPLALAGGQGLAAPVEDALQGERGSERRQPLVDRRPRQPVDLPEVVEHLARGEAAEETGAAAQVAQVPLGLRRHGVVAGEPRAARARREQAGEHAQGGGLPRPVGAEQPVDLAAGNGQRQLGHGLQGAEGLRCTVELGQRVGHDHDCNPPRRSPPEFVG